MDEHELRALLHDLGATQLVHQGVLLSVTDAVRRLYVATGNEVKWREMVDRVNAEIAAATAALSSNVVRLDGTTPDRDVEVLERIRDMLRGPHQ